MSKLFLRFANGVISLFLGLVLLTAGLYAGYALWDNNQIYAAAENVQADMIKYKPEITFIEEDSGPSFEELLDINPDVCAWVAIDNTHIDHVVVQGATNLSYINTDVYGNFALAGSIFLDSRNDREFSNERYHLLYGHNMASGDMFGDLQLYKDAEFFEENRTGMLILPNRVYELEIFACIVTNAYEDAIFEPERWQHDIKGLFDYAEENAMYFRDENVAAMLETIETTGEMPHILSLTTCSSEFTDARTIVLAEMKPYVPEEQEVAENEKEPA